MSSPGDVYVSPAEEYQVLAFDAGGDARRDENPVPGKTYVRCWENTAFTEVFDVDGRFLGKVESFGFRRNFMRRNMVIAVVIDEAGTIMVKRYRLLLPGER